MHFQSKMVYLEGYPASVVSWCAEFVGLASFASAILFFDIGFRHNISLHLLVFTVIIAWQIARRKTPLRDFHPFSYTAIKIEKNMAIYKVSGIPTPYIASLSYDLFGCLLLFNVIPLLWCYAMIIHGSLVLLPPLLLWFIASVCAFANLCRRIEFNDSIVDFHFIYGTFSARWTDLQSVRIPKCRVVENAKYIEFLFKDTSFTINTHSANLFTISQLLEKLQKEVSIVESKS